MSYLQRKMADEALLSLEEALSRDPTLTSAYSTVGLIFAKWNQPFPTANHFDVLAKQHPDAPWYTGMAAFLNQTLDVVPKATEHYERLLTFVPHYADAHYHLALLYERGADARVAMRHWNTYLALAAGSQYAADAEAHRQALRMVVISSPTDGELLRGKVPILGTAWIEDFYYYKIEFLDPETDDWQVIGELHYETVTGGLLETWDTTTVPDGAHWLRLVVVNGAGQFVAPYALQVRVDN